VIASDRQIAASLTRLERLPPRSGVVSVYLNTRWADEHQRARARVFLTRELARARDARLADPADLDWIEAQGRALIAQAQSPEADGVALFACRAAGLAEVIPASAPFEERFVVGERADLGGLARLLEEHASALVVFVDGESARLLPLYTTGAGEEVTLLAEVPGRHARGGWAQLAQSRYARHIEEHRGQHFEAVARAVTDLVEAQGIRRILLAGHEDRLGPFSDHLPGRLQALVVGRMRAARWESAGALLRRAADQLALLEHGRETADVDAVLTEAAKGGRAVAGPGTLDAVRRGAVHRLYILAGLRRPGRECERCGALQEAAAACWLCGGPTREIELAAALVDRVQRTGGTIETVPTHAGLAAAGGVAARLRYRF
jgi:peptide subunit release factor 1 (eRF1)